MNSRNNAYQRALVFSGGGTRFDIYCGMYAAWEDAGMKPGVLVAACGGAIAATIIQSFPTNAERKAYLMSEELYRFIRLQKLTEDSRLSRIGLLCLKKMRSKKAAPYMEDVFHTYLVDMPTDLSGGLPSLSDGFNPEIPTVIIGSELLFTPEMAGSARGNRKLYRKILFTDEHTARHIHPEEIQIESQNYKESAVDSAIRIKTDMPLPVAMRISVSDMFYVQPVHYRNQYYAGGAIDLMPYELARSLAETIIVERKQVYSPVEEALVRAVLGFSGNARLQETEQMKPDYEIDTADAGSLLKGHYVMKSIHLLKGRIQMSLPESPQRFAEDMEYQWQYGYRKATDAIKKGNRE